MGRNLVSFESDKLASSSVGSSERLLSVRSMDRAHPGQLIIFIFMNHDAAGVATCPSNK